MAARKKPATKAKRTPARKSSMTAKRATGSRTVKRGAIKRATTKKAASKEVKSGAISVGRKPFTKSQFITAITESSGTSKKEVVAILEVISKIIGAHIAKQGPEVFSWPGLFKIQVTKKPATKARPGINPFNGEPMTFKAKPASRRIRIRPLKQLKALA